MKFSTTLPLIILVFFLASSCGEEGVQVKIGDDFKTNFRVVGLAELGTISVSESTDINDELLEYGEFIEVLEIESLIITFENIEEPFDGIIELNILNEVFNTGPGLTEISNTASINASSINLDIIERTLENGDVSVGFTVESNDPNADNNFDIILNSNVFATLKTEI